MTYRTQSKAASEILTSHADVVGLLLTAAVLLPTRPIFLWTAAVETARLQMTALAPKNGGTSERASIFVALSSSSC